MKIKTAIKIMTLFSLLFLMSNCNEKREIIFLGIHPLTEGADGSSYRNYFYQDSLVNSPAYYVPINYKSTKDLTISVFMSNNMEWFPSDMKHDSYPKKFSFDGKGAFSDEADNDKCVFNISQVNNINRIGLFYLKQPNGGRFNLSVSHKGNTSEKASFDSNSATKTLGYAEINSENSDRFLIDGIFGKVVFFEINFKNQGSGKVTINTFAKGGTKLDDIMNLDDNFRKEWLEFFKPTTYILNAGMNDRKTIEPELFKKHLIDFISDLKSTVPDCKLILVEPNESEDFKKTFMIDYRKIRQDISETEKDIFYYSIPKSIGDYNYFVQNNMMADKVHPNDSGNKVIGEGLYDFYLANIK